MKHKYLLLTSYLLTACALQKGGDQIPDIPLLSEIPTLEASITQPKINTENIYKLSTSTQHGEALMSLIRSASNYSPNRYAFYYHASDGSYYQFNNFSTAFIPSTGSEDLSVPTQHQPQITSNGAHVLICCELSGRYATPTKLYQSRFGVWFEQDHATLFSIGELANIEGMQGAKQSNQHTPTGKATYEIWAWRTKNNEVVSSTLKPVSQYDKHTKAIVSTWHVNFNSQKITGNIIGNADFGADIELNNVHIQNNLFSGTAYSQSMLGQVSGAFYGKSYASHDAGTELGGTIIFNQSPKLNTVFGGVRSKSDPNTTDTDTNPLP